VFYLWKTDDDIIEASYLENRDLPDIERDFWH